MQILTMLFVCAALAFANAQSHWEYARFEILIIGTSPQTRIFTFEDGTREITEGDWPELNRALGFDEDGRITETLNQLGQESYEMVNYDFEITRPEEGAREERYIWYFKRQLP